MDAAPLRSVEGFWCLISLITGQLTARSYAVNSCSRVCTDSVKQAHYSIILQLLQHGETDVNQAQLGFSWFFLLLSSSPSWTGFLSG